MITVGIILVALSLAILIFALVKTRRKNDSRQDLIDEDTVIERAFEVVDSLEDSDAYTRILMSQQPVEERLALLFDNLFANGQIEASEKVARLLVNYAPDVGWGYARLGMVYLKKGNLDEAEKNLKVALQIEPEDVRSANNLGYVLNQKGRYAESVAVLESVLSGENSSVVTLVNLGIAKYHLGDVEGAFELLNSAYRKNPNIPEVHLYIGHCLEKFGEHERAKLAYARYEELKQSRISDAQGEQNKIREQSAISESEDKNTESEEEESGERTDSQPVEQNSETGEHEDEFEEEIVVPDSSANKKQEVDGGEQN